jgi:hypothetical protein
MRARSVSVATLIAWTIFFSPAFAQSTSNSEFPLSAIPADSGRIRLEWSFVSSGPVAGFLVYRAIVPPSGIVNETSAFVRIDSVGATRTGMYDTPPPISEGGSYAYRVVALTTTDARFVSRIAFVYVPAPIPPETFRLTAFLDSSSVIQLRWILPINTTVTTYLIHRFFASDGTTPPDPRNSTLIDSTSETHYSDPISPTRTGTYKYMVVAVLTSGKQVFSNTATVQVGPVPSPQYIMLQGWINPEGKPSLKWQTQNGAQFEIFYVYRAIYNPMLMSPMPPPMILIDSTKQPSYIDKNPPPTPAGYVYEVRGKNGTVIVRSNPVIVIPHEQLSLRAYRDFATSSNVLEWTSPGAVEPLFYVVYRQMLMDATSKPDSDRWMALDTVKSLVYRDVKMPMITVVYFGLAYQVVAVLPSGIIPSNVAVVPMRPIAPPPFLLSGAPTNNGGVMLKWTDALSFPVLKYYVFRGTVTLTTSILDSTERFVLVDSTTEHFIINYPPLNLSRSFAYVIEAVGTGGQRTRSNVFTIVLAPFPVIDQIAIVSEPIRTARVGGTYEYPAKAKSTNPVALFRWALGVHPPAMTVDSVTGVVQWMPSLRGWFRVAVYVYSSFGGKAMQEYEIAVGAASGVVEGMATDSLGVPIPSIIKLLKRDATCSFEYVARTDSTGAFRFPAVDVGSYIAYASPMDFRYLPQWYYQKTSPADATPILVAESAASDIRFVLQSRCIVPSFNLSGMVTDTLGAPIRGAFVAFARAEFFLNSTKYLGVDNEQSEQLRDILGILMPERTSLSLTENSGMVFRTLTDSAGAYVLRLPRGAYIGIAGASGYRTIFFLNRTEPLSADVLLCSRDSSGVNFTLPALLPMIPGSISGRVMDSVNNVGVRSRLVAFRDRFIGPNGRTDAYFGETNADGLFMLSDLPPGAYYLLALPLGGYAPAFYQANGTTIRWEHATKIVVNGNSISGIDIYVRALRQHFSGYTAVHGTIFSGVPVGGRMTKGEQAIPVNGVLVYALDAAGTVAGYSVTDATGMYSVEGLAPGTYTITADRMGYLGGQTISASPTYLANGSAVPATVNLFISPLLSDASQAPAIPTTFMLEQNYPNPFNPRAVIGYQLSVISRADLRVYDLLGREIAVLVNSVQSPGKYSVTFDGDSFASGIYFYRLTAGTFSQTKKMVLLR